MRADVRSQITQKALIRGAKNSTKKTTLKTILFSSLKSHMFNRLENCSDYGWMIVGQNVAARFIFWSFRI